MRFFFLLLCFCCSASLWAVHGGTIRGVVYTAGEHELLTGVSVHLEELNRKAGTNEIGVFVFPDLENGTYHLTFTYLGYRQERQEVVVVNHETTNVRVELQEIPLDLADVDIVAHERDPLQTISQLDIQLRPVQSAQDILRVVPGLFIGQHAGGGKAEQIFLRGFDIDHGTDIALFADGIPVNMVSHAHGQGYADLHFLIPELIQGVRFSKGMYDIGVGNFATAGQVRFETPLNLNANFIKMEAGQFDTYRLATAVDLLGKNAAARGTSAWVAGEQLFSNGYFEAPQQLTRRNIMAKLNQVIDQKQSFSLSFSDFSSSWMASGQVPDRAVNAGLISRFGAIDNTEGGSTGRMNLNLIHFYTISDKTWIKNQFYHSKYRFDLFSNFTFFLEDSINGDQIRQRENRRMSGYNSMLQHQTRIGNKALELEAGIQLRYDEAPGTALSHTLNRRTTLSNIALGDIQEVNLGAFAGASLQFSPALSMQLGSRFDQFFHQYQNALDSIFTTNTATKKQISPKIGLQWQANSFFKIFLNAGYGFHSNDTRVVLSGSSQSILPAAFGQDLGVQLRPFRRLLMHFTGWRLDLEQEFVYVGDAGVVEPGGRTLRHGVDASVRWQATPWLFMDGDYTWTRARTSDAPEGAFYIPLAPVHTAAGGITVQKNDFSGSLRARWLGDRPANEDYSLTAKGYLVIDAQLNYSPTLAKGRRPLEWTLSITNLANTAWKETQFETTSRLRDEAEPVTEIHFTPGAPFWLKSGITFKF